jgi:hypothetical protein
MLVQAAVGCCGTSQLLHQTAAGKLPFLLQHTLSIRPILADTNYGPAKDQKGVGSKECRPVDWAAGRKGAGFGLQAIAQLSAQACGSYSKTKGICTRAKVCYRGCAPALEVLSAAVAAAQADGFCCSIRYWHYVECCCWVVT